MLWSSCLRAQRLHAQRVLAGGSGAAWLAVQTPWRGGTPAGKQGGRQSSPTGSVDGEAEGYSDAVECDRRCGSRGGRRQP
jgi:hypothetical protein